MINGLEGIPGSGKSYEAVVMHVLPALKQGRRVITNLPLLVPVFETLDPSYVGLIDLRMKTQSVRGVWDANAVDDNGNGEAFKLGAAVPPVLSQNVPVFGSVWDYFSAWKHPVTGLGPLFVIDEAHLALPTMGTNQQVVEWYKLHRHFNVDVLLATQSFRDINQPVARLVAILIKCRKADILGKPKSYIRKVHAGYRGAVISTEERKYEPQYFGLYRSHTQGNGVAEALATDVNPLSVRLKWVTRSWWLLTLIFCVWAFWPKEKPKQLVKASTVRQSIAAPSTAPGAPGASVPPASAASSPASAYPPDLEPLKDKLVHITGWLKTATRTVHTFAVSGSGVAQFNVVSADLVASGYVWQPLGECMGYLRWREKTRAVTCDAPALATGTQNAPVVMDAGSGKRSDDRQFAQK